MILLLQAIRAMDAGVEQWAWIQDFHGLPLILVSVQPMFLAISAKCDSLLTQAIFHNAFFSQPHAAYCVTGMWDAGFGLRDTDPRLAKIFLDVSARHYPERLGLFYCVDAPSMFNIVWKCVQPMVDPITRAKVCFLPCVPSLPGVTPAV